MKKLYNKYPFLFNLTKEDSLKDFNYLRNYDYTRAMNTSFKGNHATNFFFQYYRYSTKFKTRKNSPIDAWDNPIEQKKIIENSFKFRPNLTLGQKLRSVFQLYYAPILQFKPLVASYIYYYYKPKKVLDFSAGWGDRLLAAMVHNVDYIGIDTNKDLKKPYKDMIRFYKPYTTSTSKIIFKKAENVDYSKYTYDFIFTSPPFYDKESYKHMPKYKSYEDWVQKFLLKTIKQSYKYLQSKGHICLHLSKTLYDEIVPLLGTSITKIPYPKQKKNTKYHNNRKAKYNEYMYIWKKK